MPIKDIDMNKNIKYILSPQGIQTRLLSQLRLFYYVRMELGTDSSDWTSVKRPTTGDDCRELHRESVRHLIEYVLSQVRSIVGIERKIPKALTNLLRFYLVTLTVLALTFSMETWGFCAGEQDRSNSCSLDAWRKQGAKITTNADGSLKSLDLTPIAELTLKVDDTISDADQAAMKSLRVVRGTGFMNQAFLQALAGAPRLTELLWTETSFPPSAAVVLRGHRGIKKLRLSGLNDKEQITAALALAASLPQLTELDLSRSAIGDELVATVNWRHNFQKLAKLNLYDVPLGDRGVTILVPLADRLNWLNLDATLITDKCMPELVKFQSLSFLHLGRTSISDNSVEFLATIKNLKTLHVTRTKMTDVGYGKLIQRLPECNVITIVGENSQKK